MTQNHSQNSFRRLIIRHGNENEADRPALVQGLVIEEQLVNADGEGKVLVQHGRAPLNHALHIANFVVVTETAA